MRTRRKTSRMLLGLVAAVALFAGTAFTASNTMPADTHAGAGTVAVSGYTAETINYNLNATDPSTIDSVDIVITGEVTATSDANLQLATGGDWYDCTVGTFNDVDNDTPLACTTTGADVETANNLTLVIAD